MTVSVFRAPGEGGKLVTDEKVLAQIAKLSPGDLTDAEIVGSGPAAALRGIHPYQAPKTATLVKVGTQKSDALTLTTVELKSAAKTDTVFIRPFGPANAADPVLSAKARALAANSSVTYKAVEDGGQQWLLDIRANVQPGEMTLVGQFTWTGKPRQTDPLKAVLKPTGDSEWSAVFTFTWDGRPKTYVGTVKGDLRNGEVSGTGNGDGRKFTFSGKSQNGVSTITAFENNARCGSVSWKVQ
jgi:hypothetical protein